MTARNDRDAAHEIALKVEAARTEISAINQNRQRMDSQLEQLRQRKSELDTAIAESEEPLQSMATELEEFLKQRVEVESRLSDARHKVEELDHAMRENSTQRHTVEQGSESIRAELDKLRMGWQEIKVRRETQEESLQETGFQLQLLLEEMPQEASEKEWTELVEKMERRIQRLGPINLAAIDEYKRLSDQGMIPVTLGSEGYPPELEVLAEGVDLVGQEIKRKFLRKIPIDPMTREQEWGLKSYQDEPDSKSWGGENVWDVYSLSESTALDGTEYKDW